MTRTLNRLLIGSLAILLLGVFGCSDDDNETGPTDNGSTDGDDTTSVYGIDVHQHLASNADFSAAALNLLASMDSLGINLALLMPPPSSGDPAYAAHYDYTDLKATIDANSERFGLVGGGKVLNGVIHQFVLADSTPTAADLDAFEADARAIAQAGAAGFGEMTVLHLSYKKSHPFIEVPANHPMFLRLADVAADVGMPIDIHLELCSEKRPLPTLFLTPPEGNNPDSLQANLAQFGSLLAHNRRANIVWVHVGWDNIGDMTTAQLRTMLTAHPNLFMALKMLDNPGQLQDMDNRPLDISGNIQSDWYDLIVEFPDRFILGADEFFGDGNETAGSPSTAGTWSILGELPDSVAVKVAGDNAKAVYRLE